MVEASEQTHGDTLMAKNGKKQKKFKRFNCGKKGHFSKQCTEKKDTQSSEIVQLLAVIYILKLIEFIYVIYNFSAKVEWKRKLSHLAFCHV